MKINYLPVILSLCLFLGTCKSTQDQDQEDPLKNSKKLIIGGHKSLFFQGAIPVKGTSIKFIPPMEEAEIFIFGQRIGFAKQEFSKSVLKAKESVVVVKEGSKMSWSAAKTINDQGKATGAFLQKHATEPGIYIMYDSVAESYGIIGSSFEKGISAHNNIVNQSELLRKEWNEWAEMKLKDPEVKEDPKHFSKKMKSYKTKFEDVLGSFVYGYVNLDESLKSAWDESYEDFNDGSWKDHYKDMSHLRSDVSHEISSKWQETIFDFGSQTKSELQSAYKDLESIADGKSLGIALLSAFAKTTKGLFYDGIIEPIGAVGILSVGYVGVNTVIYPAAVATVGAKTGLYFLAETFTLAGKGVVYIIAPNVKLALGALLGSTGLVVAISAKSFQYGSETTGKGLRKTSAYSVKGAGIITEKSGKYLLAPASLVGVTATQSVIGGGLALGGTATGATITAAGATMQTTSYAVGGTSAAVVGTTGSVTSFGVGTSYGVYQLTKAIGIPSGVLLGSGVVLGYEAIAQISAHSVLAVADCSYLVLSLEGGKWVVYGVKDVTNQATGLMAGAVIDLDQVRKDGNTIVKVPLEEGEAEKILDPKRSKKK
ncbi:DUF262 domain-containing protein [Leptospira idonii]|uniref:DUF262 domain-containing protein n=1 Tax=Leptospira idonii TaxID=1193500 RepID=A0A4R9M4S8_9LEPT|nr:DUF262 domain-containing protein [Leptospira idonii]TGN20249.1 DUF262 domain-containing protein [Leptospira idonii]